ncbi:CRISPR-associated endonuclease Cas3'' [Solidesulfovibrio sp.]|uniref:CRISPR-associated endonuclease Cas3'' n=1 Tax=Solidesulfovibrio sp. TaxID=2910990 RepID=UPI002634CA45|nr:CRISPR-associated endonuclease Cas3'' [Solidesulfovibrio sp.]
MPEERHWYAHSVAGLPQEAWQTLPEHLHAVAKRAAKFADAFGAGTWGHAAGLLHDAGKYTEAFQRRLAGGAERVDHSTAGAKLAADLAPQAGKILAYAIAGHHAGLADGKSNDPSCLSERLERAILLELPQWLKQAALPTQSPFAFAPKRMGFGWAFFIRMLYSCLVDADFLDTEEFLNKGQSTLRGEYPPVDTLRERLRAHLAGFAHKAHPSPVDPWRAKVLAWCCDAAREEPGLFSLTVPTGGGKTLSSLAFALEHAATHGLERVIYVIPYTSIIEQNADVFRKALGEGVVVEHHSNFDPWRKKGSHADAPEPAGDETLARRLELACENWDARLVVTTSVQFFESLFAARSSKCRKLHNIARSVVILDEAQMLPPAVLRPCLEALRELYEHYGTTVVLCTATQPALEKSAEFPCGLDAPREIVRDMPGLFTALKRTRVEHLGRLTDAALLERLAGHRQVLCVVNTRRHARLLRRGLGEAEGVFHLSASMCPAHRTEKLEAIRKALQAGAPCRVVSTQLIECGVDVSFPVVYRAAAGVDAVAQAGGRCNREGELPGGGVVYVFEAQDTPPPKGEMSRAAQVGAEVMRRHADVLSPAAVEDYFRTLYWSEGADRLDAKGILERLRAMDARANLPLREVSELFAFIENTYRPVIVPWDAEGARIVDGLEHAEHTGRLARRAQRYTVQIPPREFAALEQAGALECLRERFYVLRDMARYDAQEGLAIEDGGAFRAEEWIR